MNLFNHTLIEQVHSPKTGTRIAAVDCTFVGKSGRHTEGLDSFYNGSIGKAERGLEWSVVAVIDVDQGTSHALSAQQKQAGLSAKAQAKKAKLPPDIEKPNETDAKTVPEVLAVSKPQELTCTNRMDFYRQVAGVGHFFLLYPTTLIAPKWVL